jgi:DNA-binding NarL/FixJ family response regulator
LRGGDVRLEESFPIGEQLIKDQQIDASPQPLRHGTNPQPGPRVVIADDHEIVREGIRRLLARMRPKWDICGEAASGSQTLELVNSLKPNVVVLDITMPGMSGLEAARRIAKLNLDCRILIFTVHDSEWLKSEIRDTGAHGYVQKSQVARDLVIAIERLLEGGTFFSDDTATAAERHQDPNSRQESKQSET